MLTDTTTPKLQVLADATARIIVVTDTKGTVTLLSKFARQRLKITPGVLLKVKFPEFWQQVEKILSGTQKNCEFPLKIAGREYLVGINPLLDNNHIDGAVSILVDGSQLDTMARHLPSF
ncbi:MAG: hypothetical protein KAU22_03105, partial [Desulfuromonadales bacterium]|nr:hypothetical protein [Desulfuromonadales bacterium]